MILIADGGSSKTSWSLLTGQSDKRNIVTFTTEGYNPYYITQDYLVTSLSKSLPPGYDWSEVTRVGFYGAGCSESKYEFMRQALGQVFPNAVIDVAMDLLAAARCVLGREPGFSAILGTGTNSCLYDGNDITLNIDSLGFILGDEGSGAYIGKRLIRDYIRGLMPIDLASFFAETCDIDIDEVFDRVYTKPFANKYCAGFCVFINENRSKYSYLNNIVEDSFRDLFRNIIVHYPDYGNYEFNCVGSVGYYFRDILEKVCCEFGMQTGKIVKTPIEGLIDYYLSEKL